MSALLSSEECRIFEVLAALLVCCHFVPPLRAAFGWLSRYARLSHSPLCSFLAPCENPNY